ncbi:FtsW/RodA/SpoVE family cell cycle protein, partial [bacterium]|nr:FtsW/RodA/SpoVE family cell cycle protein [bacterium]
VVIWGMCVSSLSYRMSLIFLPALAFFLVFSYFVYCNAGDIAHSSYRVGRIAGYLFPEAFSNGINYQSTQSLKAISMGGFWGAGSLFVRYISSWVPEIHCDFVITSICSTYGLFGFGIILFFLASIFLCCNLFCLINKDKDMFSLLMIFGIGIQIFMQTIINISVATVILPNKGIPLPFVSHGGSSMLVELFLIGIVLNMVNNLDRPKVKEVKKEKAVFVPRGVTICNSSDDFRGVDLTWANLMNLQI